MAELADAVDLKSIGINRVGSNPTIRTVLTSNVGYTIIKEHFRGNHTGSYERKAYNKPKALDKAVGQYG